MADVIIFPEPFKNPENKIETNNINNINNEYIINNGINENNIKYVINYEESLNQKVKNFKVICCFIMCALIFIEIILEIVFSTNYESDLKKIEWTQEEIDSEDNSDYTGIAVFLISFFSNIISLIILCCSCVDCMPICSIICFILLFFIKEHLIFSLRDCCDHLDCSDYFGDRVYGIVASNTIFLIIAVINKVYIKMNKGILY